MCVITYFQKFTQANNGLCAGRTCKGENLKKCGFNRNYVCVLLRIPKHSVVCVCVCFKLFLFFFFFFFFFPFLCFFFFPFWNYSFLKVNSFAWEPRGLGCSQGICFCCIFFFFLTKIRSAAPHPGSSKISFGCLRLGKFWSKIFTLEVN